MCEETRGIQHTLIRSWVYVIFSVISSAKHGDETTRMAGVGTPKLYDNQLDHLKIHITVQKDKTQNIKENTQT